MPTKTSASNRSLLFRLALSGMLVGAAITVLAAHWSTVRHGLDLARGADMAWNIWAVMLMGLTFSNAAVIYGALALHPLRFAQTLHIEIAAAFVNRLLPSGIGGLGLHGLYLHKQKHTPAEATVVVSVNNLLGMAAHMLLLAGVLIARPDVVGDLFRGHGFGASWQIVLAVLVPGIFVMLIPAIRRKITTLLQNLLLSMRKVRPAQLAAALPLAMMLTVTYTMILFTVAHSIGVNLSVLQLFVVFSVGMLLSTATPTPGGLVGAEAGLYAGFVGYGVSSPMAAAAVVLFRFVTYWLPLLPGAVALLLAKRAQLV